MKNDAKLVKVIYWILLLFLLCAAVFFACMYADAAARLKLAAAVKPSQTPDAQRPTVIAATTPAPEEKPKGTATPAPTVAPEQVRAAELRRARLVEEQFDLRLDAYAKLLCDAVHTREGDVVLIESFAEASDLAALTAKRCYEAGAKSVYLHLDDQSVISLHKRYLQGEALKEYAFSDLGVYYAAGKEDRLKDIQIIGVMPPQSEMPSEAENEAYDNAQYEYSLAHFEEDMEKQTTSPYWVTGVYPTSYWAQKVYPELAPREALDSLWDQVFSSMYISSDGGLSAYYQFNEKMEALQNKLNSMDIQALEYQSATVDFRLRLHEGNFFEGGTTQLDDENYSFNLPSLEIFALPDKYSANGTLKASRPFCVDGDIGKTVEGLSLVFENGKVVQYSADKGEEYFQEYLERDENNAYLGEAALVSCDTPLYQSGRLFYEILLDENAGCHLALGDAYEEFNLRAGYASDENVNENDFHMDFTIGTNDLTVTAVMKDGSREAIIEKGVWSIQAD